MLFVTCFHAEYIVYYEKIKNSEDRDLAEIITREEQKENKEEPKLYRHKETTNYNLPREKVREVRYELLYRRKAYLKMILMVWAFQITFGIFILVDADNDSLIDFSKIPEIKIGLTRFICGMILHISCNAEIVNGMKMMKYSVNHHWKFSNYRMAFMAGFA